MERALKFFMAILVLCHGFFLVRYETPFVCGAAAVHIQEVMTEDLVLGVFMKLGESRLGEDKFRKEFIDKVSPEIQESEGYNGCYKIAVFGLSDDKPEILAGYRDRM